LSRDDELQGESGSIQTQRMMLRQYAAEHGLTVMDEYIDDGWSGTNFDRPGFQRMIDDIEDGKINCVVTKDLSRLGRNYILTGQYTEIYFPSKGVRYIAINDNVDTLNGESELAPFLNILNEMHARQTSKKVKAAMHTRFANGAHYGAYAPLGYIKDPDKTGHLIVDEENRWIIEKIFDMAAHGIGAGKITRLLIEEKVPTAGWINFQRDGTFAHIYAGAPEEKAYAWTIAQVKSILKEESYIGHSIHNKQSTISFKNKKKIRKPKDEWFRVENTHEAIISEELFRQVQEQIASRRRPTKDGKTQLFAGLVKCADCGWSLAYGVNKQNSVPYAFYHCSKNGQGLHQCSMHYIRYDVLYAYVLSRLQYWSQLAQKSEEKLLKHVLNASDKQRNSAKKKQTSELSKAEKRKAEVNGLFAKMYEDWSSGRITEYNFNMLSEKYQKEQEKLDKRIQELRTEIDAAARTEADAEKWVALVKQYVNITELDAGLLNSLIEKILVHEAVKKEDGTREQLVEIHYRFIGKID
jgi:DNA invertase Pin-like site-specific DNA recombinase